MSTNIAVSTTEPEKAIEFYSNVLGFANRITEPLFEGIDANPIRIFVQKDEQLTGVVMELFVDDLEEAKSILIKNGCKILRWEGVGKDCYIEDPFGLRFNIWQKVKEK
ncbi:MAG: hypothetical protein IPM69_17230 [Ignavibacteria bacterium]|nr:hypothetical protein [Ignavibacteria bacterium]